MPEVCRDAGVRGATVSGHRFAVVPAPIIGYSTGPAFVDYADGHGAFEEFARPVYAPSHHGHALRTVRVHEGAFLTMGAAARALGMTAAELSGLEHGSHRLADERQWPALLDAVRAAKVRP